MLATEALEGELLVLPEAVPAMAPEALPESDADEFVLFVVWFALELLLFAVWFCDETDALP